MTRRVSDRDDVVQRVMESSGDAAGPIIDWIDARERIIRKKDLNFATVVEVASQINAKSLDLEKIESYSMTMVMGQFGILKSFFMRRPNFGDSHIEVVGKSRKLPKFGFDPDSELGTFLVGKAQPVKLDSMIDRFPELQPLVDAGVAIVLPLVKAGQGTFEDLKGCICMGARLGNREFDDEDREFLQLLSSMIAISLHNAELYHQSIIDGLTQVYSRGHFDIHLNAEISRAGRVLTGAKETRRKPGKPVYVSLVLIDLDHFKNVNDTYGHQVGDAVLKEAAQFFELNVRKLDIVARYGGEEFALVLPETDKQAAMTLADRLREGLSELRVDESLDDLRITASFGVATFPVDALAVRDLVAQSDQALYRAKESGRNQVEGAPSCHDDPDTLAEQDVAT